MTDSSESQHPSPDDEEAAERLDHAEAGGYVKGDYGDAGAHPGHRAHDKKGQYVRGDFGDGSEPGPQPEGLDVTEAGSYVQGDYDEAGTLDGAEAPETESYTEGDYGPAGVIRPAGEAATGTEAMPERE